MKKTLLTSAIIAATLFPMSSYAVELETKQAGVAITALAAGALLGPPGMLAGFLSSIYITRQMEKNEAAKLLENEWQASQAQLSNVTEQLGIARNTIDEFETITLDQLQLQVMFHTGEDTLTPNNQKAIDTLAQFLVENPKLSVTLDGFSDPRGTDGYNNVLSDYRTRSVENALVAAGVSANRIVRNAHGANTGTPVDKDYDSYALERRVEIKITSGTYEDLVFVQ